MCDSAATPAPGEPRYQKHVGADVVCLDCGAIVAEQAAHTRFHSILSGHAWILAILKTAHVGPAVHDRYDVAERESRRKFDSWTNDAFAEVTGIPAAAGVRGRGAADGDGAS